MEAVAKNGNEPIHINSNIPKEIRCYHNWHESVLKHVENEYHIIQDGILNKKDYSLVFENEAGKRDIPGWIF